MGDRERAAPLYSTRADDPAVADGIDRFVLGLAERVDQLQDDELRRDWRALADAASDLGADAESAGYEPLTRQAAQLAACARAGKHEDAHAHLLALTHLAQRVRRGHRGAM
jgi:hypothetical protein